MYPIISPAPRYRLPLFPLPVVLMPGAFMPLHIFEPRYRDLVAHCLESDSSFGMVYHDWDDHGPFLSEEGRVGCVAEIREHERTADGRFVIMVEGIERFSINDGLESDSLYFEAVVTPYVDAPQEKSADLMDRRRRSIELFHAVVATLSQRPEHLPEFEVGKEVSFLLAQTIESDPPWHQSLLELRDEGARLERLDDVLRAVMG